LETGQLNQSFNRTGICLSASLNLLATLSETSQAEVVVPFCKIALKCGEQDTRHVLLLRSNPEACRTSRLLNLVANITTDSIGNFGKRESRDLHNTTHLALCFVDSLGDFYTRNGYWRALKKVTRRPEPRNRLVEGIIS
jgi:hypothetical protein